MTYTNNKDLKGKEKKSENSLKKSYSEKESSLVSQELFDLEEDQITNKFSETFQKNENLSKLLDFTKISNFANLSEREKFLKSLDVEGFHYSSELINEIKEYEKLKKEVGSNIFRINEKNLKKCQIRDKKRMEVLAGKLSKEIYQSSNVLFENFLEQTKNLIIIKTNEFNEIIDDKDDLIDLLNNELKNKNDEVVQLENSLEYLNNNLKEIKQKNKEYKNYNIFKSINVDNVKEIINLERTLTFVLFLIVIFFFIKLLIFKFKQLFRIFRRNIEINSLFFDLNYRKKESLKAIKIKPAIKRKKLIK